MRKSDITKSLISRENIPDLLVTLFPDSLILRTDFKIVSVGDCVTQTLGFRAKDLTHKTLEYLSYKSSLTKTLSRELINGHFDHVNVLLKGKQNIIDCSISGFYLGLISELNDHIILKVTFRNPVMQLYSQLEKSRNELDEFVYRTAHDLQGPLATIRGLVNLMRLESVESEMRKLIDMIDGQSQELNDRLHNLRYLSEFAFSGSTDNNLDCAELESKLRSTIEENVPINRVDFQFIADKRFFKRVNAELITSLINHLVLYLTNLPKKSEADLLIRITDLKNKAIGISISSDGFLSDYQLREAISQKTPLYTNIVAYSRLINFFAAQKAAQRIGAAIKIDFINETHQHISIAVPHTK